MAPTIMAATVVKKSILYGLDLPSKSCIIATSTMKENNSNIWAAKKNPSAMLSDWRRGISKSNIWLVNAVANKIESNKNIFWCDRRYFFKKLKKKNANGMKMKSG